MREDVNEKCAVVGIFGHDEASKLAYFSLHALQHRGQEAAGISSSDGKQLRTIKKRGLVMRVFDEAKLQTLAEALLLDTLAIQLLAMILFLMLNQYMLVMI